MPTAADADADADAVLRCPAPPAQGDALEPCHPSPDALALLARRRSTVAKDLGEPGPNDEQLHHLLRVATRAPDHGKLAPWRFVILQGEARIGLGRTAAQIFAEANPSAAREVIDQEETRFARAPVVVAVVSAAIADHPKIPKWEQILSCGAVCQNLLIAASAMGFAAQWLTEWVAYDPGVAAALGLAPSERIAGFVYLGTAAADPMERARPDLGSLVTHWRADEA